LDAQRIAAIDQTSKPQRAIEIDLDPAPELYENADGFVAWPWARQP